MMKARAVLPKLNKHREVVPTPQIENRFYSSIEVSDLRFPRLRWALAAARLCHEPYPCLGLIWCSNTTLFVCARRRGPCLRWVCAPGFEARGERTLPSVSDKWAASPPNRRTCKRAARLVTASVWYDVNRPFLNMWSREGLCWRRNAAVWGIMF